MLRWSWVVAVACCACVRSSGAVCPDGALCPEGTECAKAPERYLCVTPDRRAACAQLADGELCDDGQGRCYSGLCAEITCGDGVRDPGGSATGVVPPEACDDGNTSSLDGCSADCRSTEVCGNGVIDAALGERCDDGNGIVHDGCDLACEVESPRWTRIKVAEAGQRTRPALVYDPVRDTIVLFGGTLDPALLTMEWKHRGWIQRDVPLSPPMRIAAAADFDMAHQHAVIYGGAPSESNGAYLNAFGDIWAWEGRTWRRLTALAPPGARAGHAMVYDLVRRTHVMFGGRRPNANVSMPGEMLGDTWEWDGTTWVERTVPGPSPRAGHAMVYDPETNRVLLFGGERADGTSLGDLWAWDGVTWSLLDEDVSRERSRAGLVAIPGGLLMFGGADGAQTLAFRYGDTWIRTNDQWTKLGVTPPGIEGAVAMVRSSSSAEVVVIGGAIFTGLWTGTAWTFPVFQPIGTARPMSGAYDTLRGRAVILGDTQGYEVAQAAWRTLYGAGGSPMPYQDAAVAYDELHDQMVVFGGMNVSTNAVNTTLLLRTDGTWQPMNDPMGPSARMAAAMAYDRKRGRVVMFGGAGLTSNANLKDDTWEWDGTTWHDVTGTGPRPPPTSGAAMGYDPIRERVVLVGGYSQNATATATVPGADVWEWDGSAWRSIPVLTGPQGRGYSSLGWNPARRRLTMFGGDDGGGVFRDTWEWDGVEWTAIQTEIAPPPSRRHSVVPTADGSGISVVGGALGMAKETWQLAWESTGPDEACRLAIDTNENGLRGCADPNCWSICTPFCGPGETCAATAPSCGNGVGEPRETCIVCPVDVGPACPPCGDGLCEQGEMCAADC